MYPVVFLTKWVSTPNAQNWKVACDQTDFSEFVRNVRTIEASIQGGMKVLQAEERKSINWARKSICATVDIIVGQVIRKDMLIAQRPGLGLPPSQTQSIVGCTANVHISKVCTWTDAG